MFTLSYHNFITHYRRGNCDIHTHIDFFWLVRIHKTQNQACFIKDVILVSRLLWIKKINICIFALHQSFNLNINIWNKIKKRQYYKMQHTNLRAYIKWRKWEELWDKMGFVPILVQLFTLILISRKVFEFPESLWLSTASLCMTKNKWICINKAL